MRKPKNMNIDLHTHTLASDGRDTPSYVVQKAAELGLSAIAITDHDTLGGLAEAEDEGGKCSVEIIRGCELSVKSKCGEVHILAYWIPQKSKDLEQALEFLRAHRALRNKRIVEKLQEQGIDIHYEEVLNLSQSSTEKENHSHKDFDNSSSEKDEHIIADLDKTSTTALGRPHIAAVLLRKGYVSSISEAFSKYIGNNCPAYSAKKLFEVEEIMRLLRHTECTICLAHPGLIRCTPHWLEEYILSLKELGLHGIEAYHSTHDQETTDRLLALAQKHNLVVSGGSDYHGAAKPHIFLGSGKGNLRLGTDMLDKLKEHRQKLGYAVF